MSDPNPYSEEELNRYFSDPNARRSTSEESRPSQGLRGFFHRRIEDPEKAQAAFVLSIIAGAVVLVSFMLGIYLLTLTDELPSLQQIENPSFQLATVAYTADGQVLARYARQNRSWATTDDLSPHVINALLAVEDHRFHEHWGIDLFRTISAVGHTLLGDRQGGSTISQQLARNLYNEQIGFNVSVGRKLKEMVTAIELERRYTKNEIIEMYLNTVEFGNNAWGIAAASHTFYGKSAEELDPKESATLIGMLRAITYYNPVRNPDNAQQRRNVVLRQMVKHGFLSENYYQEHNDDPVVTDYHSSELEASLAPYFAEYVRNWMRDWAAQTGRDFYSDGLRVHTTLDAKLQELADTAVQEQTRALQAVVDYEWSQPSYSLSQESSTYLERRDQITPFEHFWQSKRNLVRSFVAETEDYRRLRNRGIDREEAIGQLLQNERFIDSLRAEKTRLEAGLVSLDPRTGYVKAWVGGRDFRGDKYDKVAIARRQPGSTFKPFVYTAAIDNGYSPFTTLRDSAYAYEDGTGKIWQPTNFDRSSGQMVTLSQGLAQSMNTITARVMMELVNPQQVAFYARKMGIRKSRLEEVPALALGASEVTLLELTSAYSTLANGGLYYEPTVVTRIEDRNGNVLYEHEPAPEEALSEGTAYTIIDMMRGVIDYGTGQRVRWQWGIDGYDLAGKTGTTQENADGWFMLMHPDLVTGSWVGFNDRRVAFRSNFWGQGAHNALFLVGDFFRRVTESDSVQISNAQFPLPEDYGGANLRRVGHDESEDDESGRVGW